IPENSLPEQWDLAALHAECLRLLGLDLPLAEWAKEEGIDGDTIEERIVAAADRKMAEKTANYGTELMRMAEKSLLLQLLDQTWKDHLLSLDHLRQGINLRAYAQRDPLNEYKREAFELFEGRLVGLRQHVTSVRRHGQLRAARAGSGARSRARTRRGNGYAGGANGAGGAEGARGRARNERSEQLTGERMAAPRAPWAGTPRNATCPCGSGRKFKHCHGRI